MSAEIVAVSAEPIVWAVFCEDCEAYIGTPTTDGELAEAQLQVHEITHLSKRVEGDGSI